MPASIQKFSLVIVGIMVVGLVLAGLVFVKAFDAWQLAKRSGNETVTVQNIKTIAVVESQYFYSHHRTFGTFEQLVKEELLGSRFSTNPVSTDGYVLTLTVTSDPAAYTITADPANAMAAAKHFYLDSVSREIHVNSAKPAGANDPVLNK
jgi:hypothetical protein